MEEGFVSGSKTVQMCLSLVGGKFFLVFLLGKWCYLWGGVMRTKQANFFLKSFKA